MQRGMLGTRRNGMEILVNILKESRSGITKTRLVYKTNMNFFAIRKHIDFLIQKDLLTLEHKEFSLYTTTQKGIEFLNEFDKIRETLGIEDDEIHYAF
jgi:predicted transcriptional regulator